MGRRRSRERKVVSFEDLRGLPTREYIRESTKAQAGPDHYGPDAQRTGNRAFCDRWGINPPEHTYFDTASGRSVDGRPEMQRALDEAPEYKVLVIFHSSRAFRSRADAAIWKRWFREAGVTIVFAQQDIISGNRATKMMEGQFELQDELRSDDQADFVAAGLREKFTRGLHNGTAPLGLQRYRGQPGDPRNGDLLRVETEARTVRRCYELYRRGQMSVRDVTLTMNAEVDEEGRPRHGTKGGKPLTEGGVREILGNRVYTGVVVWHPFTDEEEIRPGRHEPIISKESFDEVQRIKAERVHWRGRRPVARTYPLSRRSFCFYCGGSVAGDTGGKKNRRRMRHGRSGTCAGWRSHAAHVLEGQMAALLSERFALPKDWERTIRASLARPADRDPDDAERERRQMHAALGRLRKQHLWGDITDGEYRAEREEIERRLANLQPCSPAPVRLPDLQRAAKLLKDIGALWNHSGVSRGATQGLYRGGVRAGAARRTRHPRRVARRDLSPASGRGRGGGKWSGRRGSNPRPSAWEADTLPTELLPR